MRTRVRGIERASVPAEESGVSCWFGASSVGVLLERMRLHLGTQRFLAARRGDRAWEASCDYAALALERLESRLRPETFGARLFPANRRSFPRRRNLRGTRRSERQRPRGPRQGMSGRPKLQQGSRRRRGGR
jgi:hypothetical protein